VLDLSGDEAALLLGVLPSLLERGDPRRFRPDRVADRLGYRRHLLRALAEDVALELLDGSLNLGELLSLLREGVILELDRLSLGGDDLLRGVDGLSCVAELLPQVLDLIAPLAAVIVAAHSRA